MTTATTQATSPATSQLVIVTLEEPIERGATTITTLGLRRPKSGSLRGINLAELLQLRAEAVMVLLPRITEPPLLKHEVENMAPVDLIACATEVVDFLVPAKKLETAKALQAQALESLAT